MVKHDANEAEELREYFAGLDDLKPEDVQRIADLVELMDEVKNGVLNGGPLPLLQAMSDFSIRLDTVWFAAKSALDR